MKKKEIEKLYEEGFLFTLVCGLYATRFIDKVNIDCLHFVCILANRIGVGDLDVWICVLKLNKPV